MTTNIKYLEGFESWPADKAWEPIDGEKEIFVSKKIGCTDPDCWCHDSDAPPKETYNKTLVIIKPDAIRRKIVSKVIKRLEATGLKFVYMEMKTLSNGAAEDLYQEHKWEDFYGDLINFITSGPCIVIVLEGEYAAKRVRDIIGNKHPSDSPPGTIRGDCGGEYPETVIHGSDPWSAKREVGIFYDPND